MEEVKAKIRFWQNKRLILFLVLFLGVLSGVFSAYWGNGVVLAEGKTMIVSPMSQKMMLVPGERYEGVLSVANSAGATENLHYKVVVGSYAVKSGADSKDDYGDYDLEARTAANMMMDWITVENAEGEVAPNTTVAIKFAIDVPDDAPAGAQYATLLIRDAGEVDMTGGGVKETIQMAHVLYATVAGETIEKGEVLENNVPAFVVDGDLTTSAMVENLGNVYTDAEYILQVWPNGSDEEICTNEEKADTKMVLPGTKRSYEGACTLPAAGIYKFKQTVKIFGEESVVEGTVVYCPIWLILANLVGATLIVMWGVMVIGGKKRAMDKMMR